MKSRSIIRWGEIKKRLKGKPEKELLTIISHCYKLSGEVKYFLTWDAAVKMILKNTALLDKDEYQDRIEEMVEKTSRMGWGFHEGLSDIASDLKKT